MNSISAFVICKNEEAVIARALSSLKWADELIIVDGFSTDRTFEIAQSFSDKIFQREWTNFGEQRNFALSKCQHDWVFFLDSDEVCSEQLIEWFQNFKKSGIEGLKDTFLPTTSQHPLKAAKTQRIDLFEFRRWEHFLGRLYKYGADNPSYQWRFFRRAGAHFAGTVHEYPVVEGRIVRIEAPIYHFSKASLTEMMDKANRYSTLEAQNLFRQGKRKNVTYMFFSGFAMFLKAYFRKQGYRDGTLGFILAVLNGSVFFLRQAKLYLLHLQSTKLDRQS